MRSSKWLWERCTHTHKYHETNEELIPYNKWSVMIYVWNISTVPKYLIDFRLCQCRICFYAMPPYICMFQPPMHDNGILSHKKNNWATCHREGNFGTTQLGNKEECSSIKEVWSHPPGKTQHFSILSAKVATLVGGKTSWWSGHTPCLNNAHDKIIISQWPLRIFCPCTHLNCV